MMDNVYQYILNNLDIKDGDTLIAGISGGPDSMALLHILIKVRKLLNINIVCAHVNHNLRVESKEEEKFVFNYCKDNNIIFELLEIDNYKPNNIELQARVKRYKFFNELMKKYNSKILFTAHHGDDLMETILMRIVRGSTLKGYGGFKKITDMQNYKIVRPLISVTKDNILGYLKINKIEYATDNTNFTDEHTRNRYRKYILPALKKEDSNVHEKFLNYSELLLEYDDFVDRQTNKVFNDICTNNTINIPLFLKEEYIIQVRIIYKLLENIYMNNLLLVNNQHVTLIYNLINSNKAQNIIYLPNNIKACKSYNEFKIYEDLKKDTNYNIILTDYVKLPNGKSLQMVSNSNLTNNFICRLNSNEVKLPLYVRNKKDGDKMVIKGMTGRKKISDIFIDCKIPNEERQLWPIVFDSNDNIVWLPGLKKSKFDKQKDELCDIIIKY